MVRELAALGFTRQKATSDPDGFVPMKGHTADVDLGWKPLDTGPEILPIPGPEALPGEPMPADPRGTMPDGTRTDPKRDLLGVSVQEYEMVRDFRLYGFSAAGLRDDELAALLRLRDDGGKWTKNVIELAVQAAKFEDGSAFELKLTPPFDWQGKWHCGLEVAYPATDDLSGLAVDDGPICEDTPAPHPEAIADSAEEEPIFREDVGEEVAPGPLGYCVNHPKHRAVTELDGEHLCQDCADAWLKGEGIAAMEADSLTADDFPDATPIDRDEVQF